MRRLSDLEFMNLSEIMAAPSRRVGGAWTPEPDLVALVRSEGRFLGAVGACKDVLANLSDNGMRTISTMIADSQWRIQHCA